jgi:hypothetical protein
LYTGELKGMEGFDEDDERASVDGPVPANMTYEEWLKTQPDEVVRDILGATRFELYKNGMPITSFVSDGSTLTLKQLAEKEGIELPSRDSVPKGTAGSSGITDDQVNYEAINNELGRLRQLGKETGMERLSVMNYDGTSLGSWKGTEDAVTITETVRRKLVNAPDDTLICLHNHPKSSSFSLSDLDVMCSYNSIREMRVVGHNGTTYTMTVGDGERVSSKELDSFRKSIHNTVRTNIGNKAVHGIRTNYYSERNRLIAEHYGWTYEEGKINGRK